MDGCGKNVGSCYEDMNWMNVYYNPAISAVLLVFVFMSLSFSYLSSLPLSCMIC
jgi:hypothetical protein